MKYQDKYLNSAYHIHFVHYFLESYFDTMFIQHCTNNCYTCHQSCAYIIVIKTFSLIGHFYGNVVGINNVNESSENIPKSHNKLQMNEKESALRIEIQRKRLNFE